MSYAISLTADARRGLRTLPVEVQEAVLDFLDRLAAEAGSAMVAEPGGHHALLYREGARAFKVYVTVVADHAAPGADCH